MQLIHTCSSHQPLTFCADFPRIAQRFEAWWQGELLDRPLFLASANRNPDRPITRRLELLDMFVEAGYDVYQAIYDNFMALLDAYHKPAPRVAQIS